MLRVLGLRVLGLSLSLFLSLSGLVEAGAHGPQLRHRRLPSVAAQRHAEVRRPARPARPVRRDAILPLVTAITAQRGRKGAAQGARKNAEQQSQEAQARKIVEVNQQQKQWYQKLDQKQVDVPRAGVAGCSEVCTAKEQHSTG
jgi:hypothetical protein